MRLDYIEPIIESAVSVLAEFTAAPVERGDMKLHGNSSASKEVAAIIGMTGDVDGRVIIEMDDATAVAMAGIMNREPFKTLDRLALDSGSDGRRRQLDLVTYALTEAIAVFGLVLGFLGGGLAHFLPFLIVSLAGFLLLLPRAPDYPPPPPAA